LFSKKSISNDLKIPIEGDRINPFKFNYNLLQESEINMPRIHTHRSFASDRHSLINNDIKSVNIDWKNDDLSNLIKDVITEQHQEQKNFLTELVKSVEHNQQKVAEANERITLHLSDLQLVTQSLKSTSIKIVDKTAEKMEMIAPNN
jgi:iron-sulfur cluster repair protein YtfE (RIC family)